jgi:putative ABC transport system substrate-binding protein
LNGATPGEWAPFVTAFHNGLNEAGYVEGQNVAIEYRWAENRYDRLPALAGDLVSRRVNVIVTSGSSNSPTAAKAATATIPIVFAIGGDPVNLGLVPSLNQPRGNVTGVSFLINALGPKRLQLLHELVPTAAVIGFLVDPTNALAESDTTEMREAADALARKLIVVSASTESEIDTVFGNLRHEGVEALIVAAEAFFISHRDQLAALAAGHAIPTMYFVREFVAAGGLMSYGTSMSDAFRTAGVYVGRILKGEKPTDLPVLLPTKFELVINLKTTKALGLTVPPSLLASADEVIE